MSPLLVHLTEAWERPGTDLITTGISTPKTVISQPHTKHKAENKEAKIVRTIDIMNWLRPNLAIRVKTVLFARGCCEKIAV